MQLFFVMQIAFSNFIMSVVVWLIQQISFSQHLSTAECLLDNISNKLKNIGGVTWFNYHPSMSLVPSREKESVLRNNNFCNRSSTKILLLMLSSKAKYFLCLGMSNWAVPSPLRRGENHGILFVFQAATAHFHRDIYTLGRKQLSISAGQENFVLLSNISYNAINCPMKISRSASICTLPCNALLFTKHGFSSSLGIPLLRFTCTRKPINSQF